MKWQVAGKDDTLNKTSVTYDNYINSCSDHLPINWCGMSRKRQLALSAFFSSSKRIENEEGTGSGNAGSGEQLQQPHGGTGSGQ